MEEHIGEWVPQKAFEAGYASAPEKGGTNECAASFEPLRLHSMNTAQRFPSTAHTSAPELLIAMDHREHRGAGNFATPTSSAMGPPVTCGSSGSDAEVEEGVQKKAGLGGKEEARR